MESLHNQEGYEDATVCEPSNGLMLASALLRGCDFFIQELLPQSDLNCEEEELAANEMLLMLGDVLSQSQEAVSTALRAYNVHMITTHCVTENRIQSAILGLRDIVLILREFEFAEADSDDIDSQDFAAMISTQYVPLGHASAILHSVLAINSGNDPEFLVDEDDDDELDLDYVCHDLRTLFGAMNGIEALRAEAIILLERVRSGARKSGSLQQTIKALKADTGAQRQDNFYDHAAAYSDNGWIEGCVSVYANIVFKIDELFHDGRCPTRAMPVLEKVSDAMQAWIAEAEIGKAEHDYRSLNNETSE